MNFKKILSSLLLTLFASILHAQDIPYILKPGIRLINNKTNKIKMIHQNAKVKYWLYNSDLAEKGRLNIIKDSSIFVKGKEIKLKDISMIGIRNMLTGPLVVIGCVGTIAILPPLLVAPVILATDRNFDMEKKWQFGKTIKTPIDSSALKNYKVTFAKRDSNMQKDSDRTLSFTLNPSNILFNQFTLDIGYQLNKKISLGIGGGIVMAYPLWNGKQQLYNGTDDKYPNGVYNGWLITANLKELNTSRHHWYFQTSIFYKYLWYDHYHFTNSFGDPNPDVEWIRSEIANVTGIKFLWGKRIYVSDHFAIEPVIGCSLRFRYRSYIDWWTNSYYGSTWDVQHYNQFFPGLQGGLLLTFGNFKLKKSTH